MARPLDPGLHHCSRGGLHSQPRPDNKLGEEQGRRCLLHGEQSVVLRCGDHFFGLFSGPGAPHDQMPTLYIPREFTSAVITAVYIPPHADTNQALDELLAVIDRRLRLLWPVILTTPRWGKSCRDTINTSAVLRVVRTHSTMFTLPSRMHIRPSLAPPFGKSDHVSVLMLPSFRQKLKHAIPVTRISYVLRSAIRSAKRHYRDKVKSHYQGSNTRNIWPGLKSISDYRRKSSSAEAVSASLPALKVCADQLSDVFTDIFNMSLLQSVVPACFKEAIIVPVPKKTKTFCLNDFRPVALTSPIMKCFERLVKSFITSSLPDSLDPLQFAYRPNRSPADVISLSLHTALSHLDQRDQGMKFTYFLGGNFCPHWQKSRGIWKKLGALFETCEITFNLCLK